MNSTPQGETQWVLRRNTNCKLNFCLITGKLHRAPSFKAEIYLLTDVQLCVIGIKIKT